MEPESVPPKNPHRWLELGVPLLSFGGAFVAILAGILNFTLDYHYPAIGCVIASAILAYLAWIRPKKDIVAISTPIYAFIFFLVPSDSSVGIVLQLLYATSLTILLIRLKRRFGNIAPLPGRVEDDGPLSGYIARVREAIPDVTSGIAADAGRVFIRFARGEYEVAAPLAGACYQELAKDEDTALAAAFAIIAAEAAQGGSGSAIPAGFRQFSDGQYASLFYPAPDNVDQEQVYATTLDNALLLLYAVSIVHAEGEQREQVRAFQMFAERIACLS
ncbi:MAG: hypothetical protein M0Q92_05540 [Methanoregula sp.]|nr:hypothetical protein [Methanoregula sp.]